MDSSFSINVRRLEQHLDEVENEKDAYEKDIEAYIKENKLLKSQIVQLRESLNDSDAKAMKTFKDIQELHHKKVKLLEDGHQQEITEKEGRMRELHDAIRTLKKDLDKCKLLDKENQSSKSKSDSQLAVLKDRVNQLQKDSSDQEKQWNVTKIEQKKKISQQHIRISVLEDQLKTVRSEKEVINGDLVETQLKFNSLKSKKDFEVSKQQENLKSLQTQIKALQHDLSEKKSESDELSQQLKQSEICNRSLKKRNQDQLVAKDDEILELKSKLRAKDGEICSLSNKVASLEKKDERFLSKHTAHIDRLQTEVNQLNSESDSKEEKIRKYKRDLEKAQSEARKKDSQHQLTVSSLEKQLTTLRNENCQKDEELCSVSTKLANLESETETRNFKDTIQAQTLEEKLKRLDKELRQKTKELNSANSRLNSQQFEVDNMTSQKNTLQATLEEKVSKLESENKKKEEQLCKVSSELAYSELEVDSVSSKYRVRVRTLEDKLMKIQKEFGEKENAMIQLETQLSDKSSELQSMKNKVAKLEIEKRRKENDLHQLQNLEVETEENQSQIRQLQSEKRKLESEVGKFKCELDSASDQSTSLEMEVTNLKATISTKERLVREANAKASKFKEDLALKLANEQNLHCKVNSLSAANEQLKTDLEQSKLLKQKLVVSIEDLTEKLKKSEKEQKLLEENSSSANSKMNRIELEQNAIIDRKKKEVSDFANTIDELSLQLSNAKKENESLQERCKSLQIDSSTHSTTLSQLQKYKEQLDSLQKMNSDLISQRDGANLENKELKRKLKNDKYESSHQTAKIEEMEKTVEVLKESCMMLERQVEDLESFNNELIEKQNQLTAEKDEALKKYSELRIELKTAKHEMKAELTSLDHCSNDQITELKVELRNEMNQLHEVAEQHRDLEQKYKNLELHAAALQRKLNAEKDGRERCLSEMARLQADMEILQRSFKRSEDNLHIEIERCDELEREKTHMMNQIDTEKLEFSHELVRLNCQGQQQAKLIDFLQSRVEELEPTDKKKKKKKTTLYQAPLQYRELRDLLEEEKSSNVKLQEQVNSLRSELQTSNSKVKRLKHGMDVPLSPGSIAAISAIVKSPASISNDGNLSPKGGKQRSKPRMQHNIPHRLSTLVCHRATRCSVCLATIHFGHSACRCSECSVICHAKCRHSITNTCGLPGGLFQHFREAPKPSNMSPITCVFKGNNSDQLFGKLKVLCGDDTWVVRSVRISSGHLRITLPSAKSPSKLTDKDDVINLKQGAYVHTDLNQSELPNTAKQDLSYAFKIQTGSNNSCWPARCIYFLAAGFSEKHMWVEKLEEIIAEQQHSKNIGGNAKIFGNEILTLLHDEKLELNCSLPISEKTILFGCEEGLYRLSPSTTSVSRKNDMKKINGVSCIYQLTSLNKSTVLAIEGQKHRLISFSTSSIISNNSATIQPVGDIEGCHLFAVGQAEGLPYLCVASASSITILKYNEKFKKFCKKKEIATSEPCTCMMFTACSVIIGSNIFYEADLTEFKTDEFLEEGILTQFGEDNVFPISILKIREQEGRQEFLLCFHEFGIFVDGFGRQTRSGRIMWSRMPLSFEYRAPYLIIVQFNSIEIMLLDVDSTISAENCKLDRAYLTFPRARFLGSAITEGAIYLSSCEGGRTSVFCCKGNMKVDKHEMRLPAASKRQYAALSSSLDSLSSPTTKRSTAFFADSSSSTMQSSSRVLSKSQQSVVSDTSRWTTTSADFDDVSSISGLRAISESENVSSSIEDTTASESTTIQKHERLQWRPAKTPPAKPPRGRLGCNFDHVSSTEV